MEKITTTAKNTTKEYIFDATDKKLGRLAARIAHILMGKADLHYAPHQVFPTKVVVQNVDKMTTTDKQELNHLYQSFSGYPGGRSEVPMKTVIKKHGHEEVLRRAVRGMLPKNKLQSVRLKNLIFTEGNQSTN